MSCCTLARHSQQFIQFTTRTPSLSKLAKNKLPVQIRKMSSLNIEQSIDSKFSQPKKGQGESEAFLAALKERRTFYQISKNAAVPDSRVEEIVKYAIKHVPSSL